MKWKKQLSGQMLNNSSSERYRHVLQRRSGHMKPGHHVRRAFTAAK